jgi:hypothetical protein
MKDKILNILIPILGWKQKKGFLYKSNLIATNFIAFWLSGAGLIFLYLLFSYSQISYKGLIFYHSSDSGSVENLIRNKVAEEQLVFLMTDLLYSELPSTKIFFVKHHWVISWFLGPFNILNTLRGSVSDAITPVFASVVFTKKTSNLYLDSSRLAHELVHILQHDKYGYFATRIKTPVWVHEGYATYRQALFSSVKIDDLYLTDQYKLYGALVQHAIHFNNKTVDELHLGQVEYSETLKSLCKIKKDYWGCK